MAFKIRRTGAGVIVCNATDKLGFHGATPVVQPVGAAQAAVVGTADAAYNDGDTVESTLVNANKTLVNALRTALIALGLMRGANAGAVIGTGRRKISRKGAGVIIGGRSDLGIGFHGVRPVPMSEGDALDPTTLQAAVTETAGGTWDSHGQACLNQIKVLLNVLRALLIDKGLIAGSDTLASDVAANYKTRLSISGIRITGSVNSKLGFFGAAPTIQRAHANQAIIDAADADATWGAEEAALANACTVLNNELRTALVNKGLIKGAA